MHSYILFIYKVSDITKVQASGEAGNPTRGINLQRGLQSGGCGGRAVTRRVMNRIPSWRVWIFPSRPLHQKMDVWTRSLFPRLSRTARSNPDQDNLTKQSRFSNSNSVLAILELLKYHQRALYLHWHWQEDGFKSIILHQKQVRNLDASSI